MNLQQLIEDTRFHTKTNAVDYKDLEITNNINRHYERLTDYLFTNACNIDFEDFNYTFLSVADADITNGTQVYDLTFTADADGTHTPIHIKQVYRLNDDGVYAKVPRVDSSEIANPYATTTGPLIAKYDQIGNKIRVFPIPDTDRTGGLRIEYVRMPKPFDLSNTSQSPAIPSPFHRILSYGAAYDYSVANGIPEGPAWKNEMDRMELNLQKYISEAQGPLQGSVVDDFNY